MIELNKAICRECAERPAGCWRAVDYGCQKRFRAAEEWAARFGICPIANLLKERPKIAVLTIGGDRLPYFAGFRRHNEQYCRIAGYGYHVRETFDDRRAPSWEKVRLARDLIDKYDYLFIIDADAYFCDRIARIENLLPSMPGKSILATSNRRDQSFRWDEELPEEQTINTGAMLIRSCERSKKILEEWDEITEHEPDYAQVWPVEQQAFSDRILPKHADTIRILAGHDATRMNGRDGTFLRHCIDMSTEERRASIERHRTIVFMLHNERWERDRLRWCKETWLRDAAAIKQRVVIIRTSDRLELAGDALYVPVKNHISALPAQVKAVCKFFLQYEDWDYLFKCDDDTAISIPRFAAFDTAGRDYVGGWCRYGGETYAHGGGGYFLSRRAAAVVADGLRDEGPEDLLVGGLLRSRGIPVTIDGRFEGWGNWRKRPRKDNDKITGHTKNEAIFRAIYAETGLNPIADFVAPMPVEESPQAVKAALRDRRRDILLRKGLIRR